VAEGAPLLREYVGKTCIKGSNPFVSATHLRDGAARAEALRFRPMLSPEDAKRLADRVLDAERRASVAENPWLKRTPLMLRCDELDGLEEHEQWAIRQAAERHAHATRSLIYAVAALLVAVFGALLLLVAGGPQLNAWLLVYLLAVAAPFVAYSRLVVRPLLQHGAVEHRNKRPS
jgi:hypothetical protein